MGGLFLGICDPDRSLLGHRIEMAPMEAGDANAVARLIA